MTEITGRIPRDQNRVPVLAALSNVDHTTPVELEADAATSRLLVSAIITGGGGGGTQYTSGDATPNPVTGTVPVFDNNGTISAVALSSGLPVNVVSPNPLPVSASNLDIRALTSNDVVTTINSMGRTDGTITTQNLVPNGTATAGSALELQLPTGATSATVQTTGVYTGALSLQVTTDPSLGWVTVGGEPFTDMATNTTSATIPSAATSVYKFSCPEADYIRITALAAVTGTASVRITAGMANSTLRTPIASGWRTVSGTGGALNDTPIAATDVAGYRWVSVHTTGTFSATMTFETSNDNSNWASLALIQSLSTGSATQATTATTNTLFHGPLAGRYFRVRVSAYSSGTPTVTAVFSANPAALQTFGVNIAALTPGVAATNLGKAEDAAHVSADTGVAVWGVRNDAQTTFTSNDGDYSPQSTDGAGNSMTVGNLGAGVADAGNPVKVGGKYSTTPPTYTDGQRGDLQIGTRGSLRVELFNAGNTQGFVGYATNVDGVTTTGSTVSLGVTSFTRVYNGTTWDRQRGDTNGTYVGGNVDHDAVDAGFPIKVGGKASLTAPTAVAAADRVNAWFDLNGRQVVSQSWLFSHISTNTTTTVKSGAGILHTLVINTRGGTSTATVYDNTAGSGTVVAVIDTTLSTTAFVYDVAFATGLTIVTAGVSAADLTISYV